MGKLVKFQRGIATVIPNSQESGQPERQPEGIINRPRSTDIERYK